MPANLEPLATLIHISDLHIGHMSSAEVRRLERFPPWFKGKAGHDPRAETALLAFAAFDPAAAGGTFVFSGDLTAFGEQPQFEMGESLLRELTSAVGKPNRGAIAGNHDYWSGCYAAFPPAQPWFLRKRNRRPDEFFGSADYVRELGPIGHDFTPV